MILENTGLDGIKSELAHLDDVTDKLGFVRWQWEYNRATYDYKITEDGNEYYLRINTRAVEGKLEDPEAVLAIEAAYIGRATFPHGLDYDSPIADSVLKQARRKLDELKNSLA
jgi:hypothetical protein